MAIYNILKLYIIYNLIFNSLVIYNIYIIIFYHKKVNLSIVNNGENFHEQRLNSGDLHNIFVIYLFNT